MTLRLPNTADIREPWAIWECNNQLCPGREWE